MASLNHIVSHSGYFYCMLGMRTTGKTVILKSLERSYPEKVFVIDLKQNPDILQGLTRVLLSRPSSELNLKDSVRKKLGTFKNLLLYLILAIEKSSKKLNSINLQTF